MATKGTLWRQRQSARDRERKIEMSKMMERERSRQTSIGKQALEADPAALGARITWLREIHFRFVIHRFAKDHSCHRASTKTKQRKESFEKQRRREEREEKRDGPTFGAS
jgi:hypothetical protein